MAMFHRRLFLAGGLGLPFVAAQDARGQVNQLISFDFDHFEIEFGAVEINGRVSRAVFDTGAQYSSISQRFASACGITSSRSVHLNTFRGQVSASLTNPISVRVNGVDLAPMRLLIMPSEVTWTEDVLIAASAFAQFSLDFQRLRVAVPGGAEGSRLQAEARGGLFFLRVGGGQNRLLIDTGASTSPLSRRALASLSAAASDGVRVVQEITPDGLRPARARFESLRCGELELAGAIFEIEVQDLARGPSGFLGLDNLSAFNWSFSRQTGDAFAQRNGLPTPAWFGVGMSLRHEQHGASVVGLIVDGPALQAGIVLGDRVTAVNGVDTSSANFIKYDRRINFFEDTHVTYEIERGGRPTTLEGSARRIL